MKEGVPRRSQGEQHTLSSEHLFHRGRWQRAADKTSLRGAIERYLDKNGPDKSPEDVMHEEAERDNSQFERRRSVEYKKWEEHLQKVVRNLEKKRDLPAEETESIRPLLLVMGGAMRGAYCCGQLIALNDLGIDHSKFSTIVGMSAGSGPAAFFAGGEDQTRLAASLFMKECTTEAFLNLKRVHKVIDNAYIAHAMRSGPKALDVERMRSSPAQLVTLARNRETGKTEYIDLKTAQPDPVAALEGSSSIPPFREGAEVNGKVFVDGGFNKVELEEIIETYKPTDILVLPNTPFDYMETYNDSNLEKVMSRGAVKLQKLGSMNSLATLEAFFQEKSRFREFLEDIEMARHVNIGLLWPPDSGLGALTNDPDTVKAAVLESARNTIAEFGGTQPAEIQLYDVEGEHLVAERLSRAA